ncbi:MAG: GTPase HflX [Dongiaceae bacterium]
MTAPATTGLAYIVLPLQKSERLSNRNAETRLEEAKGLAKAINLEIIAAEIVNLPRITPSTYLGKGVVERLKAIIGQQKIELCFIDTALSPGQQRNLEVELKCKVIDRTGLILEIFGARAQTHEGRLQVELAALNYQKSRLVRAWTHLERQRGGFGFMGGPGERQLEMDRRMLETRIKRISAELADVKRTRGVQRQGRNRLGLPLVALVGYTNAGKSTLFNRLTSANVMAEDLLFATLDTTHRQVTLPSGFQFILSDTVGFIADLPTHLVAAFRATLEETTQADLILHVRDIASEDTEAQKQAVETTLADLGIDAAMQHQKILEVWNKADLLAGGENWEHLAVGQGSLSGHVAISALAGQGMERLIAEIEKRLKPNAISFTLALPATEGKALAWLHQAGAILRKDLQIEEGLILLQLQLNPSQNKAFFKEFPHLKQPKN